jgi:T-complex protein 1 subunit beta
MKSKVDDIAAHGINCFVNRQLIYNYPESLLAEKGIMVIEHADFEGVERLSLVTGGEIASTFERPDLVKLGQCELIEEIMIGEDKVSSLVCCDGPSRSRRNVAYQVLWRRSR